MLDNTLLYLFKEAQSNHSHSFREQIQQYEAHLDHLETSSKLGILQELLCVRPPVPALPEHILQQLDVILALRKSHQLLTKAGSLTPLGISNRGTASDVRISHWKGDVTTLADVTAITNAANGQMLGCFQPTHRCIDNIIHTWAGPRLRAECFEMMQARDSDLQPGEALVSRGYSLPSPFVIHTVGPQLVRGASPTDEQVRQLSRCYESILDALESLPAGEDGKKSVALCCISTGLFAFPAQQAAKIAIDSVFSWLQRHASTTITDVIFNTFTDSDAEIYSTLLRSLPEGWTSYPDNRIPPLVQADSLSLARKWLDSADAVLVCAGAGLSATEGLDYTSPALFKKHFPGFLKYGLRTLYSVFGFDGWASEQDRWGYFFTHMNMVKTWPKSPTYQRLIARLAKFGPDAHVRTSNADGFFLANGWPAEQLSSPQGSYSVLQCLKNCRPEAVVESWPLVSDALSSIDPTTQTLTDPAKIPLCRFCGSKMSICVRAGAWFNSTPFRDAENRWNVWRRRMRREKKRVVILELGAGMNTPGVLRWPNEDLVSEIDGDIRLVRAGMGQEVAVPFELEEKGLATSIEGDLKRVVEELLG
ncbi:hypothetical protein B0J13DRAFT_501219 [Dactylonectria estremocensis]|uniref:Macro domain-containing protein n=1 Tax=Dactylonectria estremocensis TaxID=1079267 RepID=A0A9P9J6V6_9HYPO|nr:hypothetical protein B0J13DRAFT_501219 [Dactylonectria estremocensis]